MSSGIVAGVVLGWWQTGLDRRHWGEAVAYDAFVSYSHGADGRLAPSLQRGMQRLAKPWFRLRALRVFLDESVLAANPDLWSSIEAALDESEWFVLLASSEAAQSAWVNRELVYWLAHKTADRILPVVTDGTWEWTLDGLRGSAVLPALQGVFGDEPRHVDLRWAHDADDLDLRNSRFRDAVAQVAAPIHGVAKDELESEDIREQRRARRLARGAVVLLVVLLAIAVATGGLALVQRGRADRNASRAKRDRNAAEHEAIVADSGRLAAEARGLAGAHLDLALLLAVEARRLDDSVASRGALEATLLHSAELERLLQFGGANTAALSRDGRMLAVGQANGRIGVRALATGHLIVQADIGAQPTALAFTRDDHTLAVARLDGTVDLRNVATGARRAKLSGHRVGLDTLQFSPNGRDLAGTDLDGNLIVWDLASASRDPQILKARSDRRVLSPPAWSPDGSVVAADDTGGNVTFWDTATRRPIGRDISTGVPVVNTAFAYSSDGRTLAAGTKLGGVRLYDARTHAPIGSALPLFGRLITWLTFSPDGQTLATCDAAGVVTLWDATTHTPRGRPLLVGLTAANRGGVLARTNRLVTLGIQTAAVWRVGDDSLALGTVLHDFGTASGAMLTHDGATLLMGDEQSDYVYVDRRRGAVVAQGRVSPPPPQSMWGAFAPDGRRVADALADGEVVLRDVADARYRVFRGHRGPALILAFSPDGRRIAAGGIDGTVLVWDVATTRRLATLHGGGGGTWGVAFSPDGRRLAVASIDGAVKLYDTKTYLALHTFPTQEAPLHLAFSPDGRTLAVAGAAGAVLLDTADFRSLGPPLTGHTALVFDVAFSRDGHTLATASDDGTIVLYDVASRQAIGDPFAANDGRATGVSLTPDGRTLFASYDGGEVVQWDLDPNSWQRRACATAGRNLTRDEWRQYLGARHYHTTCPQWPAGA